MEGENQVKINNKFFSIIISILCIISFSSIAQINFIEHTIDNNVHGLGGITACDIDDDNDIDVLGASLQDNQIILWRNEGNTPITWTKIIIGANIYSAHSVQAADIDGDDTLDVIGAAYVGTPGIPWWRNNGGDPTSWTKFTVVSNFTNAHEIYAHDLDQDGDMDVLGASSDLNKVAWWRNDGGSPITWTEQTFSNSALLAKSVHVGDFDGNNVLDVVAASILDNRIRWWRNDGGAPIQWTEFTIAGFYGAHRVQAIDLDDDGDDDVLGAAYLGHEIAWWRNDGGDPVVWTKQSIGTNFTNACIAYAIDLDGDNDKDVIGTGQGINQIAWWRNDGGNPITWTKFIITNNFTRPWPLYACDLDGDQDNDIIVGSSHNGNNMIKWWENDGVVNSLDFSGMVREFTLFQNYPNPFNPTTKIKYTLPESENVKIEVYTLLGKKVKILVDKFMPVGSYEVEFTAKDLPSGVYLYRIVIDSYGEAGEFQKTKKMVLLK
jgi:hypothetical protein